MYVDQANNIYVGKALVEAHDLESKQEWSGAALTDAAAKIYKNYEPEKYMLVDYAVPIKSNITKRMTVVNWTSSKHELINKKQLWMSRVEDGNEVITFKNQAAEHKILNTEKFHSDICVQCKAQIYH